MKKIIFSILIFFFSLTVVDAKTTFSISSVDADMEEEVTVYLKMEDSPEFGVLGINIEYDTDELTYVSSKIVGLEKAFIKDIVEDDGVLTLYALAVDPLMDDDGNIVEITFKVNDTLTSERKINIDVTDYAVDEVETLDFEVENGVINVTNNIETNKSYSLKDEVETDDEIVWKSSDESIAVVDEDGNVTFVGDGEVTITGVSEDETIFEETYDVSEKEEINQNKIVIILIAVGICLFLIIIFVVIGIKKHEEKEKN